MGKYKSKQCHGTISSVDDAIQELVSLGEEHRERADNMPENLQGGDLYSRLDEAASALEGLDTPDIPEVLAGDELHWYEAHTYGKGGDPRHLRASNAIAVLSAAVSHCDTVMTEIDTIKEQLQDAEDGVDDEDKPAPTGEWRGVTYNLEQIEDLRSSIEEFHGALSDIVDNTEGVEHPGRN